jgi:hypothetical protein
VEHYERDYDKMQKGEANLIYTNVMGMKPDLSGPLLKPSMENNSIGKTSRAILSDDQKKDQTTAIAGAGDSDQSSTDDDDDETDSEGEVKKHSNPVRPKDETAEQRKVRASVVISKRYIWPGVVYFFSNVFL